MTGRADGSGECVPPGPLSSATSTGPRQPSTKPTRGRAVLAHVRRGYGDGAVGQPRRRSARTRRSDSSELVETHRDARGDVTTVCVTFRTAKRIVGRDGKVAAQVARLAARAAGEAGEPELRRERRRRRCRRRETDPAARRARRRCRAAADLACELSRTGRPAPRALRRDSRTRRRPARCSPSASGGRTPSRLARSTSSLSRENCARPKAKPPSLPR